MWGKKIHFGLRPCLWQLHPDTVMPPLRNLSVCMQLRITYDTKWTAFIYKAPGSRHVELGLGGTREWMLVWIFGQAWYLDEGLNVNQWYSVCLTWSAGSSRLRLFLNGTMHIDVSTANVSAKQHLAPNGTLTLGVSHYVDSSGAVKVEKGNNLLGEIGQFRLWAGEWSGEELGRRTCADGDVVSWDLRQWKHDCSLEEDDNLQCALHATCKYLSFSLEVNIVVEPASNVQVVQTNISKWLSGTFSNGSLILTAEPNSIRVLPLKEKLGVNGTTLVLNVAIAEGGRSELHLENDTTSWAPPDMTNCSLLASLSDLENITVTTDNAADVVDIIQDLVNATLGNATQLPPSELNTVVEKLYQVVNVTTVTPALGNDIMHVFSDILVSDTDVAPVAVSVLNLTDKMGNTMNFPNESLSLTAPSLALSMTDVDPERFNGLTFTAVSNSELQKPNVLVNQSFDGKPIPEANATISLPSTLYNFLAPGQRNKTRVQFQFYGTQDLFQDPQTANATHSDLMLNSYIVSASINGSHVSDLSGDERVVITLRHGKAKQDADKVLCVFWDFQDNGGRGGWSSLGCETQPLSPYQTRCLCEHLTHFAVLLDVSRAPISEADSFILSMISYVGCGISAIFLGITLLTYLAFEKLRRDYPSKILINLSAALLGLSLLFLLDSWLSSFSDYSLCIVTAAALHYFVLASFTWMALEALHMYFALVKVFNTYVPAYIIKCCAVGWGVPLLIVSLVLAIDKDAYGDIQVTTAAAQSNSSNQFCWLRIDTFYVTVVAFILLVLLCNTSVFVVVLLQIRRMAANKKASASRRVALRDLRAVAGLTVLLGLTWLIGFFSFGPGKVAMMYLFAIFNPLQGFFVFLFHCAMKENVRQQWRTHLCCGALRLAERSDWSASAGGHRRKEKLINSGSSVNTSSLRNISESETGTENRKGA
ncbi:adhesion G protein-coupled receptor G4a [Vanacampus margaritifer]